MNQEVLIVIKRLAFDIPLYILGYFAIIIGNTYVANLLSFAIICLFTMVLVVFIFHIIYTTLLGTNVLTSEQVLEAKAFIDKVKSTKSTGVMKWYGLITSAAEVAFLISFGWTWCGVSWMLMTFMVLYMKGYEYKEA